jgi:glutathione S-transferase
VRLRHQPENGKNNNHPIQGAELHYFFLRGLGEVPRLLLELSETPYDSVMYFSRKEKEYKAFAPFGQMPLYTDKTLGGTWLAQQGAIVRHIARRLGMGGQTEKDEATIDMLFEGAKDIQGEQRRRACLFVFVLLLLSAPAHACALSGKKDFVHEGAASESADAGKLRMYLAAADKVLGDKKFFVYDTATYADVAMFHVLSTLEEIVGPNNSYLTDAGFPRLLAFVRRFRYVHGDRQAVWSD